MALRAVPEPAAFHFFLCLYITILMLFLDFNRIKCEKMRENDGKNKKISDCSCKNGENFVILQPKTRNIVL